VKTDSFGGESILCIDLLNTMNFLICSTLNVFPSFVA